MKKWQVVTLAAVFLGLTTAGFTYGPRFAEGGPSGGDGFRPPFACPGDFSGPASGGPGMVRPPFGRGPQGGFGPVRYLDLSQDQLNKMTALSDRFLQDTRDLRYAMDQQKLEVRRTLHRPQER